MREKFDFVDFGILAMCLTFAVLGIACLVCCFTNSDEVTYLNWVAGVLLSLGGGCFFIIYLSELMNKDKK